MPRPRRIRRIRSASQRFVVDRSKLNRVFAKTEFQIRVKASRAEKDVHLNLIGASHNDLGYPTPRSLQKAITADLASNNAPILCEFTHDFVFSKFPGRVRLIDSRPINDYLLRLLFSRGSVVRLAGRYAKAFSVGWFSYLYDRLAPDLVRTDSMGRFTERYPEIMEIMRNVLKPKHRSRPDIQEQMRGVVSLLVVGRSLVMAANVMRECRKTRAHFLNVYVGAGHGEDIFRFLHSPVLAQRYAALCVKKMRRAQLPNEIISEMEGAESVFRQQG